MLAFFARFPRLATGLPGPAIAIGAAVLPAAVVASLLSLTNASQPRFHPPAPPAPSPWLVERAEGSVAGACQIAVVVIDDSGDSQPRPGAPLRLSRVTPEGTAEVWTATTDSDGGHRFLDLPLGIYQLTARVEDRALAAAPEWRCTSVGERAFFSVPLTGAAHELAGSVRSRAGTLAPGAEIAVAQEIDSRTSLAGVARVPVAADGSYAMKLAPGSYVLLVQAPNHAPLLRKLTIGADEPQATARFTLAPAPRVRGRVLDDTGAPVAGALVALGGVFDPKQRAPSTRTEADGSFSLPVALGQEVTLTARGAGKVARASLGVVQSSFGLSGVDLVVHAGRDVAGVVSTSDGSAWAFGEVRYRIRELGLSGVEQADGEGRFVLAGMPPDADVEVWAEGNATGAWGAQVASPGNDQLALVYIAPAY